MKPPFALPAGIAMLLALSACGQTGPLYMPHTPPPRQHKGATPPAPQPVVGAAIGTDTSPPAPAAGVVGPSAGANANDTQAIQPPSPATQQ
ncbi:lipoprotein [uncultured Massilia sp.]|uniref:LPS translocon maturation chaperone LptM n=1 Tax=uncultured Massilia sp. TaxID=169973 RepID=UPI0025F7EFB1|nr:lipoprotein [uncultured Massilia sp.]